MSNLALVNEAAGAAAVLEESREDFIGVFDTTLDPQPFLDYFAYCQETLAVSDNWHRANEYVTDTCFPLDFNGGYAMDMNAPSGCHRLHNEVMNTCVNLYFAKYTELRTRLKLQGVSINVQRTRPGEGYHSWHFENGLMSYSRRVMATMLYLNDDFDGGETEFLYLHRRIQPKTGRFVIWRAGFTHIHRGNPPLSGEKFLAASWLETIL